MMNSTQQAVDFLGYQITAIRDEHGTLYVPLNELREILEIVQNLAMRLPEPASTQRFLSARDVGKMLGISARAVNKLANAGRIGSVSFTNHRRRFTKELVEDFIRWETVHRDGRWNT